MAAFEVIALDTATPQLRAPGASDTYTFPRAVEMPLGTANGVLYLNGSKVVTSGSALTFDGANFKVTVPTGTPNTDGFSIKLQDVGGSTNDVGFGVDGSGNLWQNVAASGPGFISYIGGSEQMRLTSTGLGIGTSSPASKLTVQEANRANSTNLGNLNVYTTTAQAANVGATIALGGMFSVSQNAPFGSIRGGKENSTDNNYNGYLAFQTIQNASVLTERMRLDSSGNLGLGVTPSAWGSLFRAQQIGTGGSFIAGRTDGVSQVQVGANAYFDGSNWIYVNSSVLASRYYQNAGLHVWETAPSGTAGNAISFTQAMTLDASGNLGVGETSTSGARLWVNSGATQIIANFNSTAATGGYVRFQSSGTSYGDIGTAAEVVGGSASDFGINARGARNLIFGTNNTERARIPAAGGMVVGTAALATTATDGFLYVPTCAGTPTGTPTTQTGTAPIVVDTTNNKLYFYSGGQWRDAGP